MDPHSCEYQSNPRNGKPEDGNGKGARFSKVNATLRLIIRVNRSNFVQILIKYNLLRLIINVNICNFVQILINVAENLKYIGAIERETATGLAWAQMLQNILAMDCLYAKMLQKYSRENAVNNLGNVAMGIGL